MMLGGTKGLSIKPTNQIVIIKTIKKVQFSVENLRALALGERRRLNKFSGGLNWAPSYCELKQQRTKLHAFPMKS